LLGAGVGDGRITGRWTPRGGGSHPRRLCRSDNNQIPVSLALLYRASQPGASFALAFGLAVIDGATPQSFTPWAAGVGVSADTSDFDGDGLDNLLEYALGLDPKTPAPGWKPDLSSQESF